MDCQAQLDVAEVRANLALSHPRNSMPCFRLRFLLAALIGAGAAQTTSAHAVPDPICEQIRGLAKKEDSRWFALDSAAKATVLKPDGSYPPAAFEKIVYLHTRADKSPSQTIMAAKLIFQTQDNYLDKEWVRAQNNYKRKPVSRKYVDYNNFHNGSAQDFSLSANFHLTAGSEIPFSTADEGPRSQLVLAPNPASEERSYRAYLLNFQSIAAQGSCVDFSPNFPNDTKRATIETIDLLPAAGDIYYRASIKFGLSK
jgi:hypothetical protein